MLSIYLVLLRGRVDGQERGRNALDLKLRIELLRTGYGKTNLSEFAIEGQLNPRLDSLHLWRSPVI
jgi:hypothetical protein